MNKKERQKIALVGACGRMGRAITQILATNESSQISAAVDSKDSIFLGLDSGLHSGGGENHVKITSDLEKSIIECDSVIDFSSSANLESVLLTCKGHNRPLVIGTTGLSESQKKMILDISAFIPIVFSPNMSVGVNLLFKLVEITARVTGDNFAIEILDIHHRHKKDSPSGTAEKLREILLETLHRKEENVIYGRHGLYDSRPDKEIGIHSMRAGEVIGEHQVNFFSAEERIQIVHKAEDRKTFAVGAVRASLFILKQKPGLYNMFDVLGI